MTSSPSAYELPAWPRWLLDPEHPDAPIDATEALHRLHLVRELARRVGRDPSTLSPKDLAEVAAEIGHNPEALAIVQGAALEHADQLAALMDRSVLMQAHQASQQPWWAYHPEKYGSWQEFLRAKITRGNRKYVEWICDVGIPWMEANGYTDVVRHMWDDETIGKTKILVDKIRSEFKREGIQAAADAARPLSPALGERLDAMLTDLADPGVDTKTFETRYRKPLPETHTPTPAMPAYEFLSGDGAFVVLVCTSPDQLAHAKVALKAEWRLGTGDEPWLPLLTAQAARRAGRKAASGR